MGAGMIGALLVVTVLAVIGAFAVTSSRRAFKRAGADGRVAPTTHEAAARAAVRLTSGALRALPSPPWRVVHEVGADRLTGAEHVVIGPPGAFAVTTSLESVPGPSQEAAQASALAAAAMVRGGLDDALRGVLLASAGSIVVHWGGSGDDGAVAVAGLHGVTHVDGQRLSEWAGTLDEAVLSPAQIDQAWRAVVTSIGRPDPLA